MNRYTSAKLRRESQRDPDRAARGHPDEADVVVEDHPVLEALGQPLLGDRERDLAGAGVAEASGPEGDVVRRRDLVDQALVDDTAVRVQEVERDRAPAAVPRRRAVHADRRAAVRVLEPLQLVEQPACRGSPLAARSCRCRSARCGAGRSRPPGSRGSRRCRPRTAHGRSAARPCRPARSRRRRCRR